MRAGLAGLLLVLTGCGAPEAPPHGLSDSLFAEVLIDLHLADARASTTGESRDSLRIAALERRGLDTLGFQRAVRYYAGHPEPYLAHYDAALDRLLREQRGVPSPDAP